MNLPNKLTMMRVVLVPVFMIFAAVSHYGTADFHAAYMLIAGVIFAIASITDFLDGYLARKNHLVTDFGKFMDPLADKCLTTAAFIYMVTDHVCSPIVLAVILFREFAVAGVRMLAAETGTVIAANMWGKVKTVLQMLTIIFYYFVGALAGPTDVGFVSFVTIVLCWLCGAATLLSGFTDAVRPLLFGVNVGGLGTLIASMASLISYRQIARKLPEQKGPYFLLFTLANIGFLAILLVFATAVHP